MGDAALRLTRAAGYRNAGTVEFLLDESGAFFFLEVNARLQVEHPVTEAVTGLDLVEQQLRVAAGEPLGFSQADVRADGHAMELRIVAEDVGAGFLPATGVVTALDLPAGVRVDTGIAAGSVITPFYDSLVAKVIAHGWDRADTIATLRDALDSTRIEGLATNIDLLAAVLDEPAFAAGDLDTGFLDAHRVVDRLAAVPVEVVAAAAAARSLAPMTAAEGPAPVRTPAPMTAADGPAADRPPLPMSVAASGGPWLPGGPWPSGGPWLPGGPSPSGSPWLSGRPWRHGRSGERTRWLAGGREREALTTVAPGLDGATVIVDGRAIETTWLGGDAGEGWSVEVAGDPALVRPAVGARVAETVTWRGRRHRIALAPPPSAETLTSDADAPDALVAPMHGRIVRIHVSVGDHVRANAPLLVLEAMKMEHVIAATAPGRVTRLHVGAGDQVSRGAPLVDLDALETG